jgi:hypothetical protein
MTLNELVAYIADEQNLTSPDAKARIEREVNNRYRQVTSSIGLNTTRREELSKAATIGSRFITFTGAEKLENVFRKIGTKNKLLDEVSMDEMTDIGPRDEPPTLYAVYSVTPTSVTLWMDCTPTTTFTLYAIGLGDASTLSGTTSPAFPESFHDILIHGVSADEYRRKEKKELAREAEQTFQNRLSDLRMFIAKSAYLEQYNGKHRSSEGWWDSAGGVRSGFTEL